MSAYHALKDGLTLEVVVFKAELGTDLVLDRYRLPLDFKAPYYEGTFGYPGLTFPSSYGDYRDGFNWQLAYLGMRYLQDVASKEFDYLMYSVVTLCFDV